ncbi:MAG TPA: hypothetical protein VHA52_12940 [Candidatus Babeliaceae bacterium]|nr:hypothetical protein [Candidatus Babeliaceae bacterium]
MRILGIFLIFPSLIFALYMGNPAEPQIITTGFFIPQDCSASVKIGYQGDRIFDRLLRSYAKAHGRVDHFELQTDQGVLIFNYLDRLEIYGSVGSMRSQFWFRPKADHQRREFETHNTWTGGSGAHFLLAEWGCTGIGLDAKVQYGKPGIKWITVNGQSHATGAHLTFFEWQASFAVFHTLDLFIPYLGIKYSAAHAHVDRLSKSVYAHKHFKMHSRRRFGMALGCSLSQGKRIDLNAEVQLIDEQAITFGGNIKF